MNRLFVYGTLCPNRENAHILGEIGGDWQPAMVHGTIHTKCLSKSTVRITAAE